MPRYDSTTGKLLQGSDVLVTDANEVDLPAVASPTAPAADRLRIFGKKAGGRMLPAYMGPSGLDNLMQPFLGFTKVGYFNPAGNSAATPASAMKPTATATEKLNPSQYISHNPPTSAKGTESITINVSVSRPKFK